MSVRINVSKLRKALNRERKWKKKNKMGVDGKSVFVLKEIIRKKSKDKDE